MVEPFTWTFVRGERHEEQLTLARLPSDGTQTVRLLVTTNGVARSFDFADATAATRFQCDMEAFLINTGWSFVVFSPERRRGRDRRTFPRLHERRRWWTDGMVTLKQFVGWTDDGDDQEPEIGHHK